MLGEDLKKFFFCSSADAEKGEERSEEKETKKPRALHKTASIFLRNLAPTITKQEVEAVSERRRALVDGVGRFLVELVFGGSHLGFCSVDVPEVQRLSSCCDCRPTTREKMVQKRMGHVQEGSEHQGYLLEFEQHPGKEGFVVAFLRMVNLIASPFSFFNFERCPGPHLFSKVYNATSKAKQLPESNLYSFLIPFIGLLRYIQGADLYLLLPARAA